MKTKLKIIIPTIIAIAAIIIAVICIKITPDEVSLLESAMSTAQKYLIEQDYEQAIIEYKKAIELDPKNVDAYLGLAEAYIGLGETDSAVEILERGITETNNDVLIQKLDELMDSMKISVPDITDLSRADIESILSENNIKYAITEEYNDKIPEGEIISDNIPEDDKINSDETIEIIISLGIEKVKVPDFSNLLYGEAEKIAKENKLTVSRKENYNKEIEAEYIVSQIIPADTEVSVGTNVVLEVSLGVEMVIVPDLTGLTRDEAEKILKENKMLVEFEEEYSDNIEKGYVISQSILADYMVESDTIIDVAISNGKKSTWVLTEWSRLQASSVPRDKYVCKYDGNGKLTKIIWYETQYDTVPMKTVDFTYSDNNSEINISIKSEYNDGGEYGYTFVDGKLVDEYGNKTSIDSTDMMFITDKKSQTVNIKYNDSLKLYDIDYCYDKNGNCIYSVDYDHSKKIGFYNEYPYADYAYERDEREKKAEEYKKRAEAAGEEYLPAPITVPNIEYIKYSYSEISGSNISDKSIIINKLLIKKLIGHLDIGCRI